MVRSTWTIADRTTSYTTPGIILSSRPNSDAKSSRAVWVSTLHISLREYRDTILKIHIIDVNTDVDHIHILLSCAPKLSISDAACIIKSNTARQMKKKFKFLSEGYFDKQAIWSIGYFVSTVGINESVIRKYIELQGEEDSGQAKLGLD